MTTLETQLMLRINQATKCQLDAIIQDMQKMAGNFRIANINDRSPLRNVLNTATDPMSSLEVIKNYIRYQTGRRNSSKIWKLQYDQQNFSEAVIHGIDQLSVYVDQIFAGVQQELGQEIKSLETDPSRQERVEQLKEYFQNHESHLHQALHLNLTQLYLGYLSREHAALKRW
jgi:uncharacterized membrane-anchored protein YjiN (DUF445 family)